MAEEEVGCGRPTGGVVGDKAAKSSSAEEEPASREEEYMVTARVGAKAPDFQAPAYRGGKFMTVKLSDYLGKWVMICFYPGDFTFV